MIIKDFIQDILKNTLDKTRLVVGTKYFEIDLATLNSDLDCSDGIFDGLDSRDLQLIGDSSGNVILISNVARGKIKIKINGSNNLIYFAECPRFNATIIINGNRNFLGVFKKATCNKAIFTFGSDDKSIILGEDCMLSSEINIRNTDSHPIYRLSSREKINGSKSVLIHPHVWIGRGAIVLKGVTIESGSIVAAGAIVTSSVSQATLVAGTPAKALDSGVTWLRNEQDEMNRLDAVITNYLNGPSTPE